MRKLLSIVVLLLVCCGVSLRAVAQQPRQVKVSEINVSDIATIEGRVFVMHRILDKGYYCFKNANASNTIDVYVPVDEKDELSDFDFFYDNVISELLDEFYYLDKSTRGGLFKQWSQELGNEVFEVILEDFTKGLREGNLRADNVSCEDALPFCSNEEQFIFYPNVDAGDLCGTSSCNAPYYCSDLTFEHNGFDYHGLVFAPDPAFYFMQVGQSGNLDIHIVGITSDGDDLDVDFVCWGPFSSIHDICNLSCSNMVDASYSASSDEHCYINNAQAGQYYTLLLTNYSDEEGHYTFTTTGSGATNCDIMPPVVDNNGPYCVGETIELTAMALEGTATYSWSGPNGWTSNQQNPTRPNCTLNMAGTYTCTITYNGQTSSSSTVVEVLSAPVGGFNMSQSTVCKGTLVNFTNTSTNPYPGTITSWDWSFGDGSVSILQNPAHAYSTAGTYTVTLTVGNGACTSTVTHTITVVESQTYDVYAISCGSYEWNGTTYTTSGDYCVVFPGSDSEEPEPCNHNHPFNNDFENGLGNWTVLDQDGDGHTWFAINSIVDGLDYNPAHTGNGCATSASATPSNAYTPNNYLISPRTLIISNQHTVSFWANAQDVYWPDEHFGLAVSTTNTNASSFTMIQEWTMTRISGTWHHYTVDLSAYIGQQIYVAIRHFNCTDEFRLNVDDIKLVCTDGSSIPCDEDTPFNNNFEGSLGLGNWTTLDADHDGHTWYTLDYYEDDLDYNVAYTGTGWATSASALSEDDPLNPNNFLISPRTLITANQHTLSFWASPQDPDWINEHFGVAVSTTNNTNAGAFTLLQQWSLSSASWQHYTVDLSAYIGREIYVAIRHFNSSDQFRLNIDQIELLCSGSRLEESVPTRGCDSVVCLHLTVYPELTAGFTATTVCQGAATQFTNTSTTNPSGQTMTYLWDFGDGQTSSSQNPSHTFAQPGTHQVTLTVSTGNGACTDQITNTIVVLPTPDVTITVDPGTEICASEEVTLTAEIDTVEINYVAPGDILCTDNTILRPDLFANSGKTAKGVVFYVDNSGSHGWAVSLTQSNSLIWGATGLIGPSYNHWRDAIGDLGGEANTQRIKASTNSTSHPAAWYPDASQGWYLPAIGQLNVLFGELVAVNASLSRVEGTQITDGTASATTANGDVFLWSSTEKSSTHAYALEVLDGQIGGLSKTITASGNKVYKVRAIIDF